MRTTHSRLWFGPTLATVCLLALTATTIAAEPANGDPQWLQQIKKPTNWLSIGADFRLRHETIDNAFLMDADPPGHVWSFNRYRARLWSTIKPADQVSFNARLTWEGRYWFEPESRDGFHNNEVVWDSLNARFTIGNPKQGPAVTATIGRQDLILGDGWLVLEGTPLDGSRTIYFDAARFSINCCPQFSADLIYIENRGDQDSWLRPFNSDDALIAEQNERAMIFWAAAKPSKQLEIDGYFIWKHDDAIQANGDDGDVYTLGARAVYEVNANLKARVEGAYQFGKRHNTALFGDSDGSLSAFGGLSRVTYSFNDPLKNQLFIEGEFLSGDEPGTRTNEQFDPLWGRWPQYSELYVYQATVDGRIADISNMARIGLGWNINPMPGMEFNFAYHAMFAPENPRFGRPGFGDGYFRGQLFTAVLKYKFNAHLSGHLWGEYFIPGDFHEDTDTGPLRSRQDPTMFLRAEFMISL